MAELAERCGNAKSPNFALFAEAFEAIHGGRSSLGMKWSEFCSLTEADAWLDAAMTLVPQGWRFAGSETMRGDFYAHLITRELSDDGAKAHAEAHADTLALAITAAALRAHAVAPQT